LAVFAKVTNGESFGHFRHDYFYWPFWPSIPRVKAFPQQLSRVYTVGKFVKLKVTNMTPKILFFQFRVRLHIKHCNIENLARPEILKKKYHEKQFQ